MSAIEKNSNKKKLQHELDGLMDSFNETMPESKRVGKGVSDMIGSSIDDIGRPAKTYDIDFEELDKLFKAKAKSMIESMYDFYLDSGIIDKIEYAKHKQDLDTSNISNMMWQMKTVKTTINILMDEITSGNTSPKTIAALSDMQNRFSEIMKMQANYMLFLEDSYKKMNHETTERMLGSGVGDAEDEDGETNQRALDAARKDAQNSEYFLTADPKSLVKQITEVNPLTDEEHEKMREDGEDCIANVGTKNTDPRRKEELIAERDIDPDNKKDDEDEDDSDYGSILKMI